MLNAKELIQRKIITGPIPEDNIAQHGIDLNLKSVYSISPDTHGFIPLKGKTTLPNYDKLVGNGRGWLLFPGVYEVVFQQGCDIPSDQMLLIRQRSSLLRCGAIIHSSVFDAGFKTDQIGCFMTVVHPVEIEYGARIAQIYNHQTTPVENLYDGQWQNDKQRKN